jgi:putative transposase
MQFEKGYIYHIYNQGNNHRKIFFKRENYLYFLNKIDLYINPYVDIIAWCLMPNHFHLMVLVKDVELANVSQEVTQSHLLTVTVPAIKLRSFNDSISIMLRSYTRAINKQENFSGSLFRKSTKAECINCPNGITPSFYNIQSGTQIVSIKNKNQYPQVCFEYIHQNPVKAGLVEVSTDWEFSSARDYSNTLNDGKLVNKRIAAEHIDF